MKKSGCILLALAVLLSFAGCRNKDNADNADDTVLYIAEKVIGNVKLDDVLLFSAYGDKLILAGIERNASKGTDTVKLITLDGNGELMAELIIQAPPPDKGLYVAADIDADGYIWFLYNTVGYNGVTKRTETLEIRADCFTGNADFVKSVALELDDTETGRIGHTLVCGADGSFVYYYEIMGANNGNASVYDRNGEILSKLTRDEYTVIGICKLPGNRAAAIMNRTGVTGEKIVFVEIDAQTKNTDYEVALDLSGFEPFFARLSEGNGDTEVIECNREGIYGYNLENGERTKLLVGTEYNIRNAANNAYRFAVMTGDNIFGLSYNPGGQAFGLACDGNVDIIRFAKSDSSFGKNESPAKKTITLAALQSVNSLDEVVFEFNKNNSEFEARVKEYWTRGFGIEYTALNLDILSGNIPDVIMLANDMPFENYVNKGLFADLYEFIDADPDISRDDFFRNLLTILETDGRLYAVAASFYIDTVIGKTSDIGLNPDGGKKTGWTWNEYNGLVASKPDGTIPIANDNVVMGKNDFLDCVLQGNLSEFVNFFSGECLFQKPAFFAVLEAALKFPDDAGFDLSPSAYRKGNPLFLRWSVRSFNDPYLVNGSMVYFGEDISYVGFPSVKGDNGSNCEFGYTYSIAEKSAVKDGAWKYVKFLLTDIQHAYAESDYAPMKLYAGSAIIGFPINKEAFDKMAEKELEYWEDGRVEMSKIIIDGAEVEPKKMSRQDVQAVYDLIESLSDKTRYDGTILNIIKEEAVYYFAGQKTAEEVAAIIQNRVSLYLAETG
jgi:ABC-type glycerol-3-phosphate transport system substrate-binding protein